MPGSPKALVHHYTSCGSGNGGGSSGVAELGCFNAMLSIDFYSKSLIREKTEAWMNLKIRYYAMTSGSQKQRNLKLINLILKILFNRE